MATYTKQPSGKDDWPDQNSPTTNHGTSNILVITTYNVQNRRTILYFDISDIPALEASSDITSAKLDLYYYDYESTNPVGLTTWAYKITRDDWTETGSSWNNYKAATAWTTAGGDYVTSNPAGGSAAMPAAGNWVEWDVTNIVKDAVDNVSKHANILVKFETEDSEGAITAYFYSNNYTDNTTLCPKLIITYNAKTSISVSDNPKAIESIIQTAEFPLTFTETIIPTETLITATDKNLWSKRTKPSTSYTKRTKPSTSWTERTKPSTGWTERTKP